MIRLLQTREIFLELLRPPIAAPVKVLEPKHDLQGPPRERRQRVFEQRRVLLHGAEHCLLGHGVRPSVRRRYVMRDGDCADAPATVVTGASAAVEQGEIACQNGIRYALGRHGEKEGERFEVGEDAAKVV